MLEFILQYQLAFSILFSIGTAFKFWASVVIFLGSYLITAYYENKRKDDLAQREKLNSKIEKLYGPVAANRMFHYYSLSAIQVGIYGIYIGAFISMKIRINLDDP